MTFVYAQDVTPAPSAVAHRGDTRTMWLESFDGTRRVQFDANPVKLMRGALGLTRPPEDLIVSRSPGVPGGSIEESRTLPRLVMLPLQVKARTQALAWDAVRRLRAILRYTSTSTLEGACYLMCSSTSGVRRLTVAYGSGLEGEDGGMPNLDRFPLHLVAVDPYARDREEKLQPFSLPDDAGAFLSDDSADTWETRALSSSVVFGQNMDVSIASEIPVHPRLDFVGPFGPGLTFDADTGLSMTVPAGVPAGSTLTVVTDPRAKSIRLDGQLAAGRIALPWTLGDPFLPGSNRMNVTAPGATTASRVLVAWRGGWESMW